MTEMRSISGAGMWMIVFVFCVVTQLATVQATTSLSSALAGIGSLFEYHTSDLLVGEDEGIVASFGDYNGDEFVDIFVITNQSQTLDVLLAQENKPYKRQTLIQLTDSVIASVVPTDFNGDVQMDVMLVTHAVGTAQYPCDVSIYWGDHKTDTLQKPTVLEEKFHSEPLLFDYNADMLPDLLAETAVGVRKVWLASRNKTFDVIDFPGGAGNATPFAVPQSHAFVDLNSDYKPDLLLTTETGYELWWNENGNFLLNDTFEFPELYKEGYIGQSTYADIDQDKLPEQLVPVCSDVDCTQSAVFIHQNEQWVEVMSQHAFTYEDQPWSFVPPAKNEFREHMNQSLGVMLRVGDFNLDGYPDAIVLLKNISDAGQIQRLFLLENIACVEEGCNKFPRTFQLQPLQDTTPHDNLILGTFYDIYEDGRPDVVMVTMSHDLKVGTYTPRMLLLKNEKAMDACFVKVTVASGLCYKDCPNDNSPYGVNYPGATISYRTTKTNGDKQQSISTQFSQTAHFALQTPYQIFGLSDTPNYIDDLEISIPTPEHVPKRLRSWGFIIPNSQLIVIPHPLDKTSGWMLKLYITPSQLVYLTGAALLGTCGFVAGLVGILHWREKREDKLEKKQESQRFHFDAM